MKHSIPTSLIGKGGVGLVMFHLARLGHEFMPTSDRSHFGDLWVDFGNGIQAMEVKTSNDRAWGVRLQQAARVDWFAFVCIRDAAAWLLTKQAVLDICAATKQRGDRIMIPGAKVAAAATTAWHRQIPLPVMVPEKATDALDRGPVTPGAKGNRVILRRLKDGTVKRYEYPAWQL